MVVKRNAKNVVVKYQKSIKDYKMGLKGTSKYDFIIRIM